MVATGCIGSGGACAASPPDNSQIPVSSHPQGRIVISLSRVDDTGCASDEFHQHVAAGPDTVRLKPDSTWNLNTFTWNHTLHLYVMSGFSLASARPLYVVSGFSVRSVRLQPDRGAHPVSFVVRQNATTKTRKLEEESALTKRRARTLIENIPPLCQHARERC